MHSVGYLLLSSPLSFLFVCVCASFKERKGEKPQKVRLGIRNSEFKTGSLS